MRLWLFALSILGGALASTNPAAAQNYPWCAAYRNGGTNCGFSNFAQCQAALSGNGGVCEENTQYTGPAKNARPAASTTPRHADKPKPKEPAHEKLVAPQPQ
ncbi:MAG TPA: DUF3551 domain-containing protein [Xanthobacteraceae bacterium]|nr:DUF3551 domain-containing protein [Xanthobacteraceae bacterium]